MNHIIGSKNNQKITLSGRFFPEKSHYRQKIWAKNHIIGKIALSPRCFFAGLEVEDAVVLAGFVEHLLGFVEVVVVLDGVLYLSVLVVKTVHDFLTQQIGDVATMQVKVVVEVMLEQ